MAQLKMNGNTFWSRENELTKRRRPTLCTEAANTWQAHLMQKAGGKKK
jgi:hypothetical protein